MANHRKDRSNGDATQGADAQLALPLSDTKPIGSGAGASASSSALGANETTATPRAAVLDGDENGSDSDGDDPTENAKVDRSGVYEFTLLAPQIDGCEGAVPIIHLPIIKMRHSKRPDVEIYQCITIERNHYVRPHTCEKCKHQWEPEPPLRPAFCFTGDNPNLDRETPFRQRMQESNICKKCGDPGVMMTVRGAVTPMRSVKTAYYLFDDEVTRLDYVLSKDRKLTERIETITSPATGLLQKVSTGIIDRPMRVRLAGKNKVEQFVWFKDLLVINGPFPLSHSVIQGSAGVLVNDATQKELARLDQEIFRVQGQWMLETVEWKKNELHTKLKQLLERKERLNAPHLAMTA